MIENRYSFRKHNFLTIDWLQSDPGLGIRGIHLECKKVLRFRRQTETGLHPVRGRPDAK